MFSLSRSGVVVLSVAVAGLLAGGPRAAQAQAIAGRWVAQVPEGGLYFHYDPAGGTTPDGALVGRFHHGESLAGGDIRLRMRGTYFVRQFGPDRAEITLRFDDGHVVVIGEHSVGGTRMVVFHNGRIEVYNRMF